VAENETRRQVMRVQTAVRIPEQARTILEKRTFAHLATLMPDGSPQSTPVWVDVEGDEIVINTAEGRVKPRNLREDPRVALSATDPDDPYEAVIVRGWVTDLTHDGADEHIDRLAEKYLGEDTYPYSQPGEERVKIYIAPEVVKGANE
jgi:PPOX class probable F420-dependent enzyme